MIQSRSPDPPSLDELGRRLRHLVPSWTQPQRFYQRRDEIADALHQIALHGSPEARRPAGPSEEHRLRALLVLKNDEIRRLRKLLAEACRPRPRRRRMRDDRQMLLTF
jgi:hypothetical protein